MKRRRIRLVVGTAFVLGAVRTARQVVVARNRNRYAHIVSEDPVVPRH